MHQYGNCRTTLSWPRFDHLCPLLGQIKPRQLQLYNECPVSKCESIKSRTRAVTVGFIAVLKTKMFQTHGTTHSDPSVQLKLITKCLMTVYKRRIVFTPQYRKPRQCCTGASAHVNVRESL